jgi:signal transduction histidine kinase
LPLSPATQTQLYGIGREALANVVKHAGASRATLRVGTDDGVVVLEIADDGQGFDANDTFPGHYGLESMRSRAEEIGAKVTIVSGDGGGTVVRVEAAAEPDAG